MMAATSGPSSGFTSSTCTQPSSRAGTDLTVKPSSAAVAGLVPCADSGTSTIRRVAPSPFASMAALIAIMPSSSPWAPALGDSATAGMPVRVMR